MNKNWRLTAAFGAVLVVLSGVYFFSSPTATTEIKKLDEHVLAGLTSDQVKKVVVARKEGGTLTFERTADTAGEFWKIAEQAGHAAEPAMVQQLLFGLDRFVNAGAMDPGRPETAPGLTGLGEPRLTVTFSSPSRTEVLHFGKQPPTNTTAVFYQREGDPKIYLVGVETFDAFMKPALQYRAKALVRYSPHKINRLVLEHKFLRPQGKDQPVLVQYEKSVLERYEEGAERGWYLTSPHKERMSDNAVAQLVAKLADLQAADYQPAEDLKLKGLDEPQVKFSLYSFGEEKPVEIHFGSPARDRRRWVWSPRSAEVALYDEVRFEELPRQRSMMRIARIFPFTPELARRLELEVKDLGKVVLERKELKKEGDPVSTWKWEVIEPANLKVESERLEAFVSAVIIQEVTDFLGEQDFKLVNLDPGPVKLLVETKEGKQHVCWFSVAAQGFLRKDGINEIFEVRPELVRMLQRLELNFVSMEMFNVPRDSIRTIAFKSQPSATLQPVYYKLKLDETGKWIFDDPANKGETPDPDRLGNLLTQLNYIKAESLLGRDIKTIETHRLDERVASSTLQMSYVIGQGKDAKAGELELYITDDKSDKPTKPLYYARLKDNLAVFQINAPLVLSLQKFLIKEK